MLEVTLAPSARLMRSSSVWLGLGVFSTDQTAALNSSNVQRVTGRFAVINIHVEELFLSYYVQVFPYGNMTGCMYDFWHS